MLKVKLEPVEMGNMGQERCVFCREKTPYWYVPKDVALCPTCAKTAIRSQVPDKQAWCAATRYMPWYDKLAQVECGKCGGEIGILHHLSDPALKLYALGCVTGMHAQSHIGYEPSDFKKKVKPGAEGPPKVVLFTRHGTGKRGHVVYAEILDAVTQDIKVSAPLDYCLAMAKERGYVFVKPTTWEVR